VMERQNTTKSNRVVTIQMNGPRRVMHRW
jgi:hypothetical protein